MSRRPARIYYFDSVRLGDHSIARSGSMVILNTLDTPEQSRGYPVWEVVGIEGTSATGPLLRLQRVCARNRPDFGNRYEVSPRELRLVRPEDQVEVLDR